MHAFKKELEYANIEVGEKRFVGFLLLYGFLLSAGLALNLNAFFAIDFFISLGFFFVLFFGGTYLWMSMASESKGRFVEKVLPDALQLIASNIKAGLTTERALIVSARDEFGPLGVELKSASAKVMSGTPIEQALFEIAYKIKSKSLERTLWLVSRGITSGGQMADLLMQIADDLREQLSIKEEVNANISMYVMLIFFTAAFGAPILFGVSTFIVEVMNAQMAGISMPDVSMMAKMPSNMGMMQSVMGFGQGEQITGEFIVNFSMICLFMVSAFSALTIGIINSGSEKDGIRFAPIILVICLALFFVVREILHMMFAGMIV